MSIGWFVNLADANNYFVEDRLETTAWDALLPVAKTKVVRNAYNRLYFDGRWELPTFAEATPADLVRLRIVNGEMAYYLAIHLADEDRRKGLQAQAVVEAGILKEKYAESMLDKLPVPPVVEAMLASWELAYSVGIVDLERDETRCANEKVSGCK